VEVLFHILSGEPGELPAREAGSLLTSVLGDTRLFVVAGDQQHAIPGRPLGQPVVVRVTAGAKPARGVPVRFKFLDGRGEVLETVKTGPDGLASAPVSRVDYAGRSVNEIEARVDWPALLSGEDADIARHVAETSAVRIAYKFTLPRNVSIAICVSEDKGDSFGREASRLLRDAGFEPQPCRSPTVRRAAARLEGQVTSTVTSTGSWVEALAECSIRLTFGSRSLDVKETSPGADSNSEAATAVARRNLARRAIHAVIGKILEDLSQTEAQ
jgi:hypothetical protein